MNSASPLRYLLLRAISEEAGDPDKHVTTWLEHGAPLGIEQEIPPGGHFPLHDDSTAEPLEVLESAETCRGNHPSFLALDEQGGQPARDQLCELVEQGFGILYTTQSAAEKELGVRCYPAPLGDVVRPVPGAPAKHRLIQDLRRNRVNACAAVPERQVLPRFEDHARDVAVASEGWSGTSILILDYKNAFMTVPASGAEQQYNCCVLEEPVHRHREPLTPDEPKSGKFVAWRVLGFGGRAAVRARDALSCASVRLRPPPNGRTTAGLSVVRTTD